MALKACPSLVTCLPSQKLCDNWLCVDKNEDCPDRFECDITEVICPDGSCSRSNKYSCGNKVYICIK